MSKIDLSPPTDLTMVSAATFAGADRPAGWQFLAVVAAVAITLTVKASETEAALHASGTLLQPTTLCESLIVLL